MLRYLALLLILPLLGCATPRRELDLKKEYTTIQGYITSPPALDGSNRLFVYIRPVLESQDAIGEAPKPILMCVTANREKERILASLQNALRDEKELVLLYGQPVAQRYEEYVEGIDFEFVAISYFQPPAEKYVTIMTVHGDSAMEVIRSVGWKGFLSDVVKQTLKRAITR